MTQSARKFTAKLIRAVRFDCPVETGAASV